MRPTAAILLNQPNGTGPYKFSTWDLDQRINLTANDAYWGNKALTPNLEFQWNNDSRGQVPGAASGAVDGIDNPGKDDLPAIEADAQPAAQAPRGHQHDVLRHEQQVRAVEQPEGAPGHRHGHRPPAAGGQLLPARYRGG